MVRDDHPLAGTEIAGPLAGRRHLTHDLVPEDGGMRGRPAELGEVRSAESAAPDPEQELAGADRRGRAGLQADLARSRVDGRPHRASWPRR